MARNDFLWGSRKNIDFLYFFLLFVGQSIKNLANNFFFNLEKQTRESHLLKWIKIYTFQRNVIHIHSYYLLFYRNG